MKFTYLTMLIYFILSLSSLSAAVDESLSINGDLKGMSMSKESGNFCLTYKGNVVVISVTLVEEVNNSPDKRHETKEFPNDGQAHQECWPFYEPFGKLFHFDYKINCATTVSVTY